MRHFLFLTLLLCIGQLTAQDCPQMNIAFTSQQQVDSFSINYPDCQDLIWDLTIFGSDITNLNSLSQLNSTRELHILECPNLIDWSGLDNLTLIDGDFILQKNGELKIFNGLPNVEIINGGVFIYDNLALESFTALPKIVKSQIRS